MVDRNNRHAEGKYDGPNRASQTVSAKTRKNQSPPVDELIMSLANARENRRARQVNEWERIYSSPRIFG